MAVATEQQESTNFQEMTDEQKAIVEMVRSFVDNEILPNAEEYDHEDKFPEAIVEQMKELGLFGVTIPEEYGGMGLDLTTYTMIVEVIFRWPGLGYQLVNAIEQRDYTLAQVLALMLTALVIAFNPVPRTSAVRMLRSNPTLRQSSSSPRARSSGGTSPIVIGPGPTCR